MDLRDELRAMAREVLGSGAGWAQLVDAGWSGLEVPEALGGAGVTFAETAVVLEELGRAAASTPYLGTALAVGALTLAAPDEARDALLERIASGATAAFASGFEVSDGVVSGTADFVPDAAGAEVVVLFADDAGEPVLLTTSDLTVTPQPLLDETRALATVAAANAPISASWVLTVDPERLSERAAVALACDSLGVAEAMLAATVDYVKVRRQFDRPIGTFQAVKHACADMLVKVSLARQLIDDAVALIAAGRAAADAASMAKSYSCGMAVDVVGKAMQLHGGIGYTWESGVHVYLKRAALNRALFGSPAEHRALLAERYDRFLAPDGSATCTDIAVYEDALTYGSRYRVLARDEAKRQVQVRGDNARERWFPEYCFDLTGQPVARLVSVFTEGLDAPNVDVSIEFSDGTWRWCTFTTPDALAQRDGDDVGEARLLGCGQLVVSTLTEAAIEQTLRHLESKGELRACTRRIDPK